MMRISYINYLPDGMNGNKAAIELDEGNGVKQRTNTFVPSPELLDYIMSEVQAHIRKCREGGVP